jgi:glutaconate CoA-transferase subunit B
VTDLAVMEITHETGTMQIVKLMPNVGLATVLDNLQFAPAVSPHLIEVELPTAEQIRILREEVDPAQAYLKRDGAVAE